MGGGECDCAGEDAYRLRFEHVYRRHRETIYRYCLRRLQDIELAEDACSAVFMEAWRRRKTIDFADRDALPWLYGVAKNVLRNQRRAARRWGAAVARVPRPISDFECTDDVDNRVDTARAAQCAHRLIDTLPSGERAVVILCMANELSYATAADRLGVPIGTVRSRLSRARKRLTLGVKHTPDLEPDAP